MYTEKSWKSNTRFSRHQSLILILLITKKRVCVYFFLYIDQQFGSMKWIMTELSVQLVSYFKFKYLKCICYECTFPFGVYKWRFIKPIHKHKYSQIKSFISSRKNEKISNKIHRAFHCPQHVFSMKTLNNTIQAEMKLD